MTLEFSGPPECGNQTWAFQVMTSIILISYIKFAFRKYVYIYIIYTIYIYTHHIYIHTPHIYIHHMYMDHMWNCFFKSAPAKQYSPAGSSRRRVAVNPQADIDENLGGFNLLNFDLLSNIFPVDPSNSGFIYQTSSANPGNNSAPCWIEWTFSNLFCVCVCDVTINGKIWASYHAICTLHL